MSAAPTPHDATPPARFCARTSLSAAARGNLHACARTLAAVAVLSAASRLSVPFVHTAVPFTLQPQAVLLVAASLGAPEACAAVLGWLLLALAGAPVLAGVGGSLTLAGPTAGYLMSYLPVAALVGRFGRGHGLRALAVWTLANACILAAGTAYLAAWLGLHRAVAVGLVPFAAADAGKLAAVFAARTLAGTAPRTQIPRA